MLSFRPCSKTSLDDLTWGDVSAGVAGLWNALLIGAVLYCLTPVAQYLPLNALAAIVIVGVVNVMDFGHLLYLARVCAKYLAVYCHPVLLLKLQRSPMATQLTFVLHLG